MDGLQKEWSDQELKRECEWVDQDLATALKTIVTENVAKAGVSNFIFDNEFALQAAKKIRENAPSNALFDIESAVRQGISEFLDMERNKTKGASAMKNDKLNNILNKISKMTFASAESELAKIKDEVFRRIITKFLGQTKVKAKAYIEATLIEIQEIEKKKEVLEKQLQNQMEELKTLVNSPSFLPKRTAARELRQEIAMLEGDIAIKMTAIAAIKTSEAEKDKNIKRYYRLENSGWRPELGRIIKGIMGDVVRGKNVYKEVRIAINAEVEKFDTKLKVIQRDQIGRSHKVTKYQNAKIPRDVKSISFDQLKNKAWYKEFQKRHVPDLDNKLKELIEFINNMPDTWKKYAYMYMLLDPPAEEISQGIGKSIMRPPEKNEINDPELQENYRQGLEASLDEMEGDEKELLKKNMDKRKNNMFGEARRLVEGGSENPNWIIWLLLSTEVVATEYGDTAVERFEKTISNEDRQLLEIDDTDEATLAELTDDQIQRRNELIEKEGIIGALTVLNGPKVISRLLWNKNIPDWVLMKIASLSRNPDIISVAEQILEERGWAPEKDGKKYIYDKPTKEDAAEESKPNARLYQPTYSKKFKRIKASGERLSVRMADTGGAGLGSGAAGGSMAGPSASGGAASPTSGPSAPTNTPAATQDPAVLALDKAILQKETELGQLKKRRTDLAISNSKKASYKVTYKKAKKA